jgi:DNA polymerase V
MTGAGQLPGDIAIIDRSLTPVPGCIVLALIDGEFTIKRYRPRDPQNPAGMLEVFRVGA